MSLVVGEKLGPYTIVASLGAGGMGEVYRAHDDRLGRDVALKILPPAMKSDPDRLRRFALEARAAGSLDHPNIIAVHDFEAGGDQPYIVTELLEGSTLRDHLRGAPLPVRKALTFASQIARALAAAHDKGIVHRDLKPENLFVLRDGRIKILDFGLAKASGTAVPSNGSNGHGMTISATDHTSSGAILGSAGYMSPEQVQGHPADHRSDVFSFGAVLYEMLAGKRCFDGETHVERAYAILKDHPASLRAINGQVSNALERVVLRCLEKSPADRFQSSLDLAFELELLLEHTTTNTGPSPLVESPLSRFDRRPIYRTFAALAAVALAFVIGSQWTPEPSPPPETPHYRRITFRRGWVGHARFHPDGRSVVYSAAFAGERRVYISELGSPEERALTPPNMNLLAVSPRGEMALALFELGATKEVRLARAPLSGGAPREVIDHTGAADFSPDGDELAVVRFVDGRARLEYPIGKVILELDTQIYSPRISPKGDLIAFVHWPVPEDDRGSVDVVDLKGNRRSISGPWISINGLAWSRDGSEVYFSASKTSTHRQIYAVTLDGKERLIAATAGSLMVHDIAPNGSVLATRTSRGSSLFMGSSKERQRDMSWFDHSVAVDLTKNGERVLFIESGEASPHEMATYFRESDGSPAVRVAQGRALAISPDGAWALIAPRPAEPELKLVPTGAGMSRSLPPGPISTYQIAKFFPDGQSVVIGATVEGGARQVFLQSIDGSPPRAISPKGYWLTGRPSPDGRFVLARDVKHRLVQIDVESSEMTVLENLEIDRVPLRWSEDGRRIIVLRSSFEFPLKIDEFDLQSGAERAVMEIEAPETAGLPMAKCIVMAPSSDVFAYSFDGSPRELYVIENLR